MTKTDKDNRLTNWLEPTEENKAWLTGELSRAALPGHGARKVAEEIKGGVKTGRIALARVEA